MAKYRLGSLTLEAIDTFVRVSLSNFGGPIAPVRVAVTKMEIPTSQDVIRVIAELKEYPGYWPDKATLIEIGRAVGDARNNKMELCL